MAADYYALLGVEPGADVETIKAAYCKMAQESHPDRGGSHQRMLLLNEAWDTLSDPQRRSRYDETRTKAQARKRRKTSSSQKAGASTARKRSARKSRLAEDFARAQFNDGVSDEIGCPEAGNSISGQVFVLVGVASVGVVFGCLDMLHPGFTPVFAFEVFCAVSLGLLGARVGALAHMAIGRWIGGGGDVADNS